MSFGRSGSEPAAASPDFAFTEALTRLSEGHTHESAYEALKAQFTERSDGPRQIAPSHGENRGSSSLGSASNSNDLAPMGCLFELLWGVFGE